MLSHIVSRLVVGCLVDSIGLVDLVWRHIVVLVWVHWLAEVCPSHDRVDDTLWRPLILPCRRCGRRRW